MLCTRRSCRRSGGPEPHTWRFEGLPRVVPPTPLPNPHGSGGKPPTWPLPHARPAQNNSQTGILTKYRYFCSCSEAHFKPRGRRSPPLQEGCGRIPHDYLLLIASHTGSGRSKSLKVSLHPIPRWSRSVLMPDSHLCRRRHTHMKCSLHSNAEDACLPPYLMHL